MPGIARVLAILARSVQYACGMGWLGRSGHMHVCIGLVWCDRLPGPENRGGQLQQMDWYRVNYRGGELVMVLVFGNGAFDLGLF